MSKKRKKVKCAFDKWSIELINGGIKIEHGHWPNIGTLKLYDLMDDDVENLAALFAKEVCDRTNIHLKNKNKK